MTSQTGDLNNIYFLTGLEARSHDQGSEGFCFYEHSLPGVQVAASCCILA